MHKRKQNAIGIAGALVALVLAGATAAADGKLTLSGSEEVPAVNTSATGTGNITVKDDKTALPRANPSPGYKLMRGLVFHPDLGPAAARRQWAHHAKLAVQVHVGVARYTQHWVEEVLTRDAALIGGFSELLFRSVEAMRDRYFDSPRGQQEILHDIGHFIASGSKRFYGREYLIK